MCIVFISPDGAMGVSAWIRISTKNLVAPVLRSHPLIKQMEPIEGEIFFILDTGADVTTISAIDARRLGIETKYLPATEGVVGVGGQAQAFRLDDVEIGLPDKFTPRRIQFHIEKLERADVLEEKTPKLPSILGNDLLKKFNIKTYREKGYAELKRIPKMSGEFRIVSIPLEKN